MDHHTVAAISLTGIFLDVLGGLYLAYDLLGGVHGPLRLLTRAVTYSILLGIGYGIGLGWIFGVTAGVAMGITMAIELNRMARKNDHYPLRWEAVFSFPSYRTNAIRRQSADAAPDRTLCFSVKGASSSVTSCHSRLSPKLSRSCQPVLLRDGGEDQAVGFCDL